MIFCFRCGVQLAPDAQVCPLCQTSVPDEAGRSLRPDLPLVTGFPREYSGISYVNSMRRPQMDQVLQISLTLALLTPIPVLVLIWLLQPHDAPWILWLAGGIFFLWFILIPARILYRRPLLLSIMTGTVAIGVLVAIDVSVPPLDWSIEVAAPIALMVAAATLVCYRISRGFSQWDLPVIAVFFLCGSILTTVIDGLVNTLFGQAFIGPMSILLVIAVPTVAIAYYLHYIAGIRIDLQKLFHL